MTVVLRLYRGTSRAEAQQLLEGKQVRSVTHWCESYEKAAMYSKGAVVCLVFDEVPPHLVTVQNLCEGDSIHGTFTEYKPTKDFFESYLHCWAEDDSYVTFTGGDKKTIVEIESEMGV